MWLSEFAGRRLFPSNYWHLGTHSYQPAVLLYKHACTVQKSFFTSRPWKACQKSAQSQKLSVCCCVVLRFQTYDSRQKVWSTLQLILAEKHTLMQEKTAWLACKVIGQSLVLYPFKMQVYLEFHSIVTLLIILQSNLEWNFFFFFLKMVMHNISSSYQISDDTQALIGIG